VGSAGTATDAHPLAAPQPVDPYVIGSLPPLRRVAVTVTTSPWWTMAGSTPTASVRPSAVELKGCKIAAVEGVEPAPLVLPRGLDAGRPVSSGGAAGREHPATGATSMLATRPTRIFPLVARKFRPHR
ncbi:MAG: hypothetical protein MUQ32_01720, partial [Chloroflexi bacterium]|nr:hypothetical protein [Chloroflexota bacterium]